MQRAHCTELLDDLSLSDAAAARAYEEIARVHRWLGNRAAILRLLRPELDATSLVLDIGCGHGALMQDLRRELGVRVCGIDLRPAPASTRVCILTGDAVVDALPSADVAIAMCVAHHLVDDDLVRLIRNVSRSCRRLILLDPVRHRLPLWLFRTFAAPLLHRINAADGATSIRRSFTRAELRALVDRAVDGSSASVVHTVAPLYIRQVVDIRWR